jgi:hypothetical protein
MLLQVELALYQGKQVLVLVVFVPGTFSYNMVALGWNLSRLSLRDLYFMQRAKHIASSRSGFFRCNRNLDRH